MTASWSFGDGDEARIVPGSPLSAEITSRGRLPLRTRSEGSFRVRASCPGTAVLLGDDMFEVTGERFEEGRVVYRLRPWQDNEILRGHVVYDESFVRAVRAERERARIREKARPLRALLNPLVGSLPEGDQVRLAERYGLYAVTATVSSALLEILLVFAAYVVLASRPERGVAILLILGAPGIAYIPLLALGRAFAAVALREASGQWAVVFALSAWRALRPPPPPEGFVPLTRDRFFRLLEEEDLVAADDAGSFVVRSVLPHVSWTRYRFALVAGVQWEVQTLPLEVTDDGPLFVYRLIPPWAASRRPLPMGASTRDRCAMASTPSGTTSSRP